MHLATHFSDKYLDAVQGQDPGHNVQGRHVQGMQYLRAASSKGRIVQGTKKTSDTFCLGTHCSGTHRPGIKKLNEKTTFKAVFLPVASSHVASPSSQVHLNTYVVKTYDFASISTEIFKIWEVFLKIIYFHISFAKNARGILKN
jgi:hypothetical protein